MMKFAIGNHLTPYLLVTCGLLTGTLALESYNLVQTQVDGPDSKQSVVKPVQRSSFSAPALAAFSEITERPLFIEGREPPAEPVQVAAAVKISPLRLQLEGVALTPDSRIAILRDLANNKMVHLAPGSKHQGWELTSVTDTVATFKRNETTQELTLKKNK